MESVDAETGKYQEVDLQTLKLPPHCKLVTLRGPSGSGKSTTARILVKALNNIHSRLMNSSSVESGCFSAGSDANKQLRRCDLPETIVLSLEEAEEASQLKDTAPPLIQLFESDYFTEELGLKKALVKAEMIKRAVQFWQTGTTKLLVFEGIFNMARPHWVEMFQELDDLLARSNQTLPTTTTDHPSTTIDSTVAANPTKNTTTTWSPSISSNFCWDTPQVVTVSRHSSRMKRNIFNTDEMLGWYHAPHLVAARNERQIHIDPVNPLGLVPICMRIYDTLEFYDFLRFYAGPAAATGVDNDKEGDDAHYLLPTKDELRKLVEDEVQALWDQHVALRRSKQLRDIEKRLDMLLRRVPLVEVGSNTSATGSVKEAPEDSWWIQNSLQIGSGEEEDGSRDRQSIIVAAEVVTLDQDHLHLPALGCSCTPPADYSLHLEIALLQEGEDVVEVDAGAEAIDPFSSRTYLVQILLKVKASGNHHFSTKKAISVLVHRGVDELKARCAFRFHVDFFKNEGR